MSAAENMYSFENIIANGKEPVMTKQYKPQVAQKFKRYMNPQDLKQHVLKSEAVRQIIKKYADAHKIAPKKVEKEAQAIIDEIGLDRNLAIIRCCGMAITAIGKRICQGIYVNKSGIDDLKTNLGKNPVLYLPSHRSYVDFILMSYICFHYDIEIPGIAAGMDFHSMFAIGTMLRKTGAFFMRRSFSNDELYWDIFRQYLYALVASYHIGVEFFVEGTRSRNFKALAPKIGLLSMALTPYFTGEVADVTIVPISISYERVLEEELFVYELLGVPKPKETTRGFFKSLKILDKRFGSMHVSFGAPISIKEYFGNEIDAERLQRAACATSLQKLSRKELQLVKKLANEIVYQQQTGIVLNTFNITCLYYAAQLYTKQVATLDTLAGAILSMIELFEALGARVAINKANVMQEIINTLELHANVMHLNGSLLEFQQVDMNKLQPLIDVRKFKAHALSAYTMATAIPLLSLQLYINPTLFWLSRCGFLILASLRWEQECHAVASAEQLHVGLRSYTEQLQSIFKDEFITNSSSQAQEYQCNWRLLEKFSILHIRHTDVELEVRENIYSCAILAALAPFLCLYYQLALTLSSLSATKEYTAQNILKELQQRIEKEIYDEQRYENVHPYCLALDNLNIALNYFVQTGFVLRHKESGSLRLNLEQPIEGIVKELYIYCSVLPFQQYFNKKDVETSMCTLNAKL